MENTIIETNDPLERWRLVLGHGADEGDDVPLNADQQKMDDVMDALYDSNRQGGLGASSPNINRWLGDIRKYFPSRVVQVMQKDAMQRLGLQQMLLEPELLEAIEPDVHLVGTLISLQKVMQAKTRETARQVVRKVVEQLEKRLKPSLLQAMRGAIRHQSNTHRPKYNDIDWHRTIRLNMKHYQAEYKTIIPRDLRGYGRKGRSLKHVMLLIDQSGSMATSVVYASVLGAALASIRAIQTRLVVFDTAVVDLTEQLHDPVEMLFGTQLGGGTDINKALQYAQNQIVSPRDTILLLITDLFEGGDQKSMLKRAAAIKQSGAQFVTLLALSDDGEPAYDHHNAAAFAEMNIPVFACTPDAFPEMLANYIKTQ